MDTIDNYFLLIKHSLSIFLTCSFVRQVEFQDLLVEGQCNSFLSHVFFVLCCFQITFCVLVFAAPMLHLVEHLLQFSFLFRSRSVLWVKSITLILICWIPEG